LGDIYLPAECKVEHRWRGSIFFPYLVLAEYEIGVLWNRILFTMLLMLRSIPNFNIPPGAYPGHLTVESARGGGNLNVAFEEWEI